MTSVRAWWGRHTLEDRIWLAAIVLTLLVIALFLPILMRPDFPQEFMSP